ncbi:MAG: hypothetical protein A2754_01400 [Candidatus Magasanikbacteria bacterium RIFCSPHIGHO2_01_FULL_47_8]|uniref:phosphoglycerate mutase (2,3-diphosphoglycerate-dependent) n=1 Tax=Candidatus Magasanikbacteria bacterium RIFCSPHIGHO2_01_FULL_47_8 TaxID=1798673 RepID=A0A1F6MCR3_9BACT|nr:MAG: hypothetical protein A2754_01400 [Candidatus Magasanikbacteria bacterium RIFCSPHIGHO2_01_FULL_47_8]
MLPENLILVRHGESEGNVAKRHSEEGNDNDFTPEFRERHNSVLRLTDRGIEQAQAAGEWLKGNGLGVFDRYYCSEYLRAVETASHLGLPQAEWRLEYQLRERDHGLMDIVTETERRQKFSAYLQEYEKQRFYSPLPDGESFAQLCTRLRSGIMDTLHRECSGNNSVILVTHGDTMRGLRVILERTPAHLFHIQHSGRDISHRISNCQIFHYTRRDPVRSATLLPHLGWVRSVCPWDSSRSSGLWQSIARRTYTNDNMLALVQQFPRHLDK